MVENCFTRHYKHHISNILYILSRYEHSVQFYASKNPKKYMTTHSLLNNVSCRKGGNIKCFNKLQIPPNFSSNFYLSFSSRSKSLSKLCYLTACESISAARTHFHNYFLRVHLLVSANYRLESTRNLQRRVLCADCVGEPTLEISFRYKKDTVATVEEYSLPCFFFFFFFFFIGLKYLQSIPATEL